MTWLCAWLAVAGATAAMEALLWALALLGTPVPSSWTGTTALLAGQFVIFLGVRWVAAQLLRAAPARSEATPETSPRWLSAAATWLIDPNPSWLTPFAAVPMGVAIVASPLLAASVPLALAWGLSPLLSLALAGAAAPLGGRQARRRG